MFLLVTYVALPVAGFIHIFVSRANYGWWMGFVTSVLDVTIVSITTAGLQAGEEPMVAVRLASGTIRDTTFSRISAYRAPQGEGEGGYVPPPSSATS